MSVRYAWNEQRRALCDQLSFCLGKKLVISRDVLLALVDSLPVGVDGQVPVSDLSTHAKGKLEGRQKGGVCCAVNRSSNILFLAPGQSHCEWVASTEDPYFTILGETWQVKEATKLANLTLSARFEEGDVEDKKTVGKLVISKVQKKKFKDLLEGKDGKSYIAVENFRAVADLCPHVIGSLFCLLHKAGLSMNAFAQGASPSRPRSQSSLLALRSSGGVEFDSRSEDVRSGGLFVRFRDFPHLWTAMFGFPLCVCYWFTDYTGWVPFANAVVPVLAVAFMVCTVLAFIGRPHRLPGRVQCSMILGNLLFAVAFLVNMCLMATAVAQPGSLYGQLALFEAPVSSCAVQLFHLKFGCPELLSDLSLLARNNTHRAMWLRDKSAPCPLEFEVQSDIVAFLTFDGAAASPACDPETVFRVAIANNSDQFVDLPVRLGREDHDFESLHHNGNRLFNNWCSAYIVVLLITIGSSWGNGTRFACLDLVWLARLRCGGTVGGKRLFWRSSKGSDNKQNEGKKKQKEDEETKTEQTVGGKRLSWRSSKESDNKQNEGKKKQKEEEERKTEESLVHALDLSSIRIWHRKYQHDALIGSMFCGLLAVFCGAAALSFTFSCLPVAGLSCFRPPKLTFAGPTFISRGAWFPRGETSMLTVVMAPVLAVTFVSLFRLLKFKKKKRDDAAAEEHKPSSDCLELRTRFRWQSILFATLMFVASLPVLLWVLLYQSSWMVHPRPGWLLSAVAVPLAIRTAALGAMMLAVGTFVWRCIKALNRHEVRMAAFADLIARPFDAFAFVEANRDVSVRLQSVDELQSWILLRTWVLDHCCRRYLAVPLVGLSFAIAMAVFSMAAVAYGVLFIPNVDTEFWIMVGLTPVLTGSLAGIYAFRSLSSMNQMADSHCTALERCRLELCSARRTKANRVLMEALSGTAQLLASEPKHFRLFGLAVTPRLEKAILLYVCLATFAIVLKVGFGVEVGVIN